MGAGTIAGAFLGEGAVEGTAAAFSAGRQAPACWAVKAQKPKGSCYLAGSETSGRAGVRTAHPGSSLTVFFVDLHQGLVGLLCSCQAVLRLGREDTRSGHTVPCLPEAASQQPRSQAPNLWL